MTEKIFKYELEIKDEQTIELPPTAKVLCVQMQRARICLWAVVNADRRETVQGRTFYICPTGNPLLVDSLRMSYIGTVQMRDGDLVWHVFEKKM